MMPNKTYDKLVAELERIFHIHSVCLLLEWDEQVNLPPGASNTRAGQLAVMAELYHRAATNPEIGEWLETLEEQRDALTNDQKVVLKENYQILSPDYPAPVGVCSTASSCKKRVLPCMGEGTGK